MSKKIFTLIYGDQLKSAPSQKIIPADSFSILQNAEEVLKGIKVEAEKYREEVVKEVELTKEQGFKEGYEEGLEQWAERLVQFERDLEGLYLDLQRKVVPIALKAAKKIVGKEIELSPETIVDIVASSLRSVVQHKKIMIYVNKKDLEVLEKNKQKLRELFENLESFSIRSREDISVSGCVIETEIGIINAQSEQRWQVLEKAFESLMKTSPEAFK